MFSIYLFTALYSIPDLVLNQFCILFCNSNLGNSIQYCLTLAADKFGCELPLLAFISCSLIDGESSANIKYTVLGDGEIEEGQVWEAAMFAAHKKLDNLVAVVDNNGLQIDGPISEVCSPEPITDKFAAFGWHVITMDAHDFDDIDRAFSEASAVTGKPVVIVQKSTKGKGVSFMENQVGWHGTAPNKEQYEQAMAELGAQLKELED